MASFLRSVLQVMLGAIIGWTAAVYYLPSSRPAGTTKPPAGPVVHQPAKTGPAPSTTVAATTPEAPADTTLFGRPGGTAAPGAFAEPRAESPKPAPVAVTQPEEPASKPEPQAVTTPAAPEEPVDFRELCIKPAAWPPIITLNKEINAQVTQGEEVIAEIPLSAGEKLQVSKVYGDATVEVRAKGAKFIVKAADTDLAAQARVRLAEISGRPRAPAPTPVAAAPVVEPTPAPKEPTPAPRRGDDLDSKMRSLFGTPEKR